MATWFELGNIYSPVAITRPDMQKGYQLHPSYRKRVANVLRDVSGVPPEHVQSMVNDIMTDSVINKGQHEFWAYLSIASFFVLKGDIQSIRWML